LRVIVYVFGVNSAEMVIFAATVIVVGFAEPDSPPPQELKLYPAIGMAATVTESPES
jgi:hypothetical protein